MLQRHFAEVSKSGRVFAVAGSTPAIRALHDAGVEHRVHRFEDDVPADAADIGYAKAAALALGVDEVRVFKTLVVKADERFVVALVPSSGNLSLRKIARVLGARTAVMAAAPDAQRMTGYVVGGISPFGQKRRLATVVDETVRNHASVFVSAGRCGWDVELDPDALVAVTAAVVADIAL